MRVLMEEGEPPLSGLHNGDSFSMTDGRLICRQRVTPCRPDSAAQRFEVNGVVRASKWFGNGLTAGEQAAMFQAAGGGANALETLIAILSSIYEGDVPELPTEVLIGDAGDPVIGGPAICPQTSSLTAVLSVTSPVGDERGWFAASRPMSVGRVPRREDLRVIRRGFSFPVLLDVGDLYLKRFGFFQPSGFMMLAARSVSAQVGNVSSVVSVLVALGCGSDSDCDVSSPNVIPSELGSTAFSGSVNFASAGMLSLVSWAFADTSFACDIGSGFVNGGNFNDNVRDLGGGARTSNTTLLLSLVGTAETCSVPCQLVVQSMMGP